LTRTATLTFDDCLRSVAAPAVLLSLSSKESSLAAFVDRLQRQAEYSFTRNQAVATLSASPETLTKALQRLQAA